jgi:hypothetical protein
LNKRVTIVMDENLMKKLRIIQAKQIRDLQKNISFSSTVESLLKTSLK